MNTKLPTRKEKPLVSWKGNNVTRGERGVTFHDEIAFGDGTRVLVHRLIDQGAFSSVYVAQDVRTSQLYALKKIDCRNDQERIEQCQKEAALYRKFHHDNIMPLLDVTFVQEQVSGSSSLTSTSTSTTCCYMRFPYLPRSLRDDMTARRLLEDTWETKRRPYSQQEALTLFAGIVSAVHAMHQAGVSHRDIRVENVLLQKTKQRRGMTPLLADLGSAGPLTVYLQSQEDLLHTTQDIERNTTASYRAPELWREPLERRNNNHYGSLHFGHADIWSLGCLLFAMLYGTSPLELTWRISLVEGAQADGTAVFVGEPTYETVLNDIPFPPCGTAADRRYGEEMKELIRWILNQAPQERPSAKQILDKVGGMIGNDKS